MPLFESFRVLKKKRQQERIRFVPVVMHNSSNRPADVQKAYSLGANGYLKMPVRVPCTKAMQAVRKQPLRK